METKEKIMERKGCLKPKEVEKDIIKGNTVFTDILKETIDDSYKRLIEPSIDREIRSDLTEKAEEKAIKVFGQNAKQLLLERMNK